MDVAVKEISPLSLTSHETLKNHLTYMNMNFLAYKINQDLNIKMLDEYLLLIPTELSEFC